ncbi:periphilin-1 isoform X2 [Xenopus tropicalis]|uniref:Periphilin-1 isoform X2 n=1 Tax=Xenopus tropicalis TaxID=8364 RepID=A0A8J0QV37_XENTR|nr:periphilin-1 isoform X2 [Xenopus tropicalis]XP_004910727.1 periphilin-1 isoform X2 [Xenopus tropicalis]|eukprot:XP_002933039.2 PREDICTED: periphilin-1-like isoform X2 [Xenopus tropicalis]
MYQRGGDRGWHQGHDNAYHHQRDVYPVRSHCSRPYRGGHPRHREHGNYGSEGYHEYPDNSCHERNYGDGQYMDYEEPPYHSEDRPYQEYRDSGYSRGGHHDSGYHKGSYYRGGYRGGDQGRYHSKHSETYRKKHSSKYSKVYSKDYETAGKSKFATTKPAPKVVPNPVRSVVVLVSGDEGERTVSSKEKTGAEETPKPTEDTKTESTLKDCVVPASEVKQECPEDIEIKPVAEIKTEITEEPKEESLPIADSQKDDTLTRTVKREHSGEGEHSFNNNKSEGETCTVKKLCSERIPEMCCNEDKIKIPLLDDWTAVSPPSPVTPGVSDQGGAGSEIGQEPSETALALRTAFILTKKEELEMAYAQDCRTFAFVADTLLKKNPTIQAAIASALRSSLYDLAGRCVHELTSFIESYDRENNVLFSTEKNVQDPDE